MCIVIFIVSWQSLKVIYVFVVVKIDDAVQLQGLVSRLQEERAAVTLQTFVNKTMIVDDVSGLQQYVENGLNISRYDTKTVSLYFTRQDVNPITV